MDAVNSLVNLPWWESISLIPHPPEGNNIERAGGVVVFYYNEQSLGGINFIVFLRPSWGRLLEAVDSLKVQHHKLP